MPEHTRLVCCNLQRFIESQQPAIKSDCKFQICSIIKRQLVFLCQPRSCAMGMLQCLIIHFGIHLLDSMECFVQLVMT